MKILTIVGARPQFIKAAPVSREIRKIHREVLVHTGQHYDDNMSRIFFEELKLPKPDYNLGVGSGSHGEQTGKMIMAIENVLMAEKPDCEIVYGDTNSTVAGALAAAKLHIPVIHIEAGLRSYNRKMPEEINRVLTDQLSTVLSCPTITAVDNLRKEGFSNIFNGGSLIELEFENKGINITANADKPLVINTGDVMYDAVLYNIKIANKKSSILAELNVEKGEYYLATVHRAENTDDKSNLKNIFTRLQQLNKRVVVPMHPRTRKRINEFHLDYLLQDNILVINPLGYLDMLNLISNAYQVITDSGGVQKEAYMLKTPCITLRDETEWVETLGEGWNRLVGLGGSKISEELFNFDKKRSSNIYGDGKASQRIVKLLEKL